MSTSDVFDQLQQALGTAYVIERELGGGGMSRVFVADEAALGRKVVVKVLRLELTEALSAERFKREVRLAARLQHPHIVALLAAGEIGAGLLYYTMPYVDGESLRARLSHDGALPIAQVVRILSDLASALAYAHRAGVVHRDVKPENILLSDGGAVITDFGIAKAISASRDEEAANEPRRSATLTGVGISLGTPAYMAPEQAAGDAVDHRADLYSLGVVAYEMLAGRSPFEGRTVQQQLAAHAVEAPDQISKRRPSVPGPLGALVMRLLEKNPADRPQSADDVRRVVDELSTDTRGDAAAVAAAHAGSSATASRGVRRSAGLALFGVATALIGATIAAMLMRSRTEQAPQRTVMSMIAGPAGQELRPEGGLGLSPDGSRLALVASDANGATAVWIRSLDSLAARRLEGSEGGSGPFWSPDGASLGYFGGGQLRVVDLRSGATRKLCPARRAGGGTWTTKNVIVYSPDFLSSPLFKVSAEGGPCTQLTKYRPGESIHRRPSALPDGRHVLFSNGFTGMTNLLAADVATGAITEVRASGFDAQFVAPDWMLFRDAVAGPLYAQRLDLATLTPRGEMRAVLNRIMGIRTLPGYAALPGALVVLPAVNEGRSLVWVNRQSSVVDSILAPTDPAPYFGAVSAAITRDGRRIAFAAAGPLWIYDRDRKVATRTHAERVAGQAILDPAWDPGDSLLVYRTLFGGDLTLQIYHVGTDRSDSLFASGRRNTRTPVWSPDGRRIAFQLSAGDTVAKDEIWMYSFAEHRASRAWEAAGNLSTPRWSPDGEWLAYVSDETGAPEVYVRRVSGAAGAVRVSTAGGEFPTWRADGRELYYRSPNGAIMAVAVRLGPSIVLASPSVAVAGPPFSRTVRWFDVTPDGQRFIAFGREDPLVFTLVLNWASRLPAR